MGESLDYINNAIANGDCDSSGEIFYAFDEWEDDDYDYEDDDENE